ncbi:unnamed protein product [Mesocestoides corti]|uniref:Uncharacterized protein n=1 Tax=Mesocestoides corti TaxID=53468 RepID=A0A0R3UAX3_MESCO|nr:unnamed protein product [Mesocestoides corti]
MSRQFDSLVRTLVHSRSASTSSPSLNPWFLHLTTSNAFVEGCGGGRRCHLGNWLWKTSLFGESVTHGGYHEKNRTAGTDVGLRTAGVYDGELSGGGDDGGGGGGGGRGEGGGSGGGGGGGILKRLVVFK